MHPRASTLRLPMACMLVCAVLLAAGPARAERADRDKPIQLEANSVVLDEATQVGTFSGDVVLTQGTLAIRGDQIVATQGKRGFVRGLVTGSPAHFRQKRDRGGYVQGSGKRIEYNAATGVMDIFGDADVKRGQEEVRGEHIVYNLRHETFQVSGAHSNTPGGRVHVVIPPRGGAPAAPAAPPPGDALPIKPDTRLPAPEDK